VPVSKLRRAARQPTWLLLTPFIDVLLVLIAFILSISFQIRFAVDVSLPQAQTGRTVQNDTLTVTIRRDGEVVVGGQVTSPEGLDAVLDNALKKAKGTPLRAFIQGDEEIPYSLLVKVMDALRRRGIVDLSLLTREGSGK
jgi:biopolymer transport protein ExbD